MDNIYKMMVNIILENLKIIFQMEKELNIIQMEIYYMMVILKMVNLKEMENIFGNMVDIIQDNGKMD